MVLWSLAKVKLKCPKGKKEEAKAKPGRFRCKFCEGVAKKKSKLCFPKKIKK